MSTSLPTPPVFASRMVRLSEGDGANAREVVLPYEDLLVRYGVSGFIRIPVVEFGMVERGASPLGHFNLGATNHEVGKQYLLMPLLVHGTYPTATTVGTEPLLTLAGARVVRCVRAEHSLPIDSLTSDYFQNTIGAITDHASLRAAILRRYQETIPGFTPADIEARGVAYTLLV